MSRTWYEYGDWRFAKAKKEIERMFRKSLLTLPFDEINQLSATEAREAAEVLYRRLRKLNRECFEDILEYVYYEAWLEAKPGTKPRKPPRGFIDQRLREFNAVTKYVYNHEIERKQSRFFEALVADSKSKKAIENDYKVAEKNWEQMTEQYCIGVEDEAAQQAYNDVGVWRVMWMSEQDDRRCKECKKRHGRRYALGNVPPKPHWHCRCWLVPLGGS